MVNENVLFTLSIDLRKHPMKNAKLKFKKEYYLALEYFVKKQLDNKYTSLRLEQYKIELLNDLNYIEKEDHIEETILTIVHSKIKYWRRRYKYLIMCDIALILMDDDMINEVAIEIKKYISKRYQKQFGVLLRAFKDTTIDIKYTDFEEELISQYRRNRTFINRPIRKFIVTANMSAGKSTLINALIGKSLTRTSQEVCTSNICYLFNKPYEDNNIHLQNTTFTYNANEDELSNISWDSQTNISSYFRVIDNNENRICIIDTPGVNSTLNRKHREISCEILKNEQYEKVIYILNANKLGTDEEIAHIKWISKNILKEKVIFVLNKLDSFNINNDNILDSIKGVEKDLVSLGFKNPIICPMSAYFALLIKMKLNGDKMTDDEIDEYYFYNKKFKRPAYDLSKYYKNVYKEVGDSEIIEMSKKCGIYGLEKILFGGIYEKNIY